MFPPLKRKKKTLFEKLTRGFIVFDKRKIFGFVYAAMV